jgi:CubicO group peptidase (beta-lactamase class C family)
MTRRTVSTKRKRLFPLLVILAAVSSSCSDADRSAEFDALGSFVDSLAVEYGVPGVGFALFDASGLLYEHVGGVKSRSTLEPIDTNTAFEAASISKPVFAYVVFSLARDGVLELDAPLETLVPEIPEVAYDSRSAALTPRILLTHLGGLPNWRSRINFAARSHEELFAPDDTLRFVLDPETEYLYSGEGYVLLQRIVEEITGQSLVELARERVFEPLGMARSSFLFDAEMRTNYSLGHDGEGDPDKWEIALPLASSTLHTTAADLAGFGAHLASKILMGGRYSALGTPAVAVGEADRVDEADEGDELVHGWGQGLGVVTDGGRRYIYHGGNNVIFIADFIYGVEENMGYVLLTNSSNGRQMVAALERRVFGRDLRR